METKDIVNLMIALLSACVAVYAAIAARAAVHTQRRAEKWSTNHDLIARASTLLAANPELLRLHGITPEELAEDGVEIDELLYAHLQLDAGSAYFQVGGDPVVLTEFRKAFLRSGKVQMMWKKYFRGNIFNPGEYARAVDAFIEQNRAEIDIPAKRKISPKAAP
jgi:hypothetical protein